MRRRGVAPWLMDRCDTAVLEGTTSLGISETRRKRPLPPHRGFKRAVGESECPISGARQDFGGSSHGLVVFRPSAEMELAPRGPFFRKEWIWVDELVLETLAASLNSARELTKLARICTALKGAATSVARRKLQALLHRMQTALPPCSAEHLAYIDTVPVGRSPRPTNLVPGQRVSRHAARRGG